MWCWLFSLDGGAHTHSLYCGSSKEEFLYPSFSEKNVKTNFSDYGRGEIICHRIAIAEAMVEI